MPGSRAKIIKGVAYAPSLAPRQVQEIIWAGNQIRTKPYVYGGGHGVWKDFGYDCSGSVSYVLHAARLLKTSMDSTGFESWGQSGKGQWVTVYTNPGHAFIQVAGIRFDTSAEGDPQPASGHRSPLAAGDARNAGLPEPAPGQPLTSLRARSLACGRGRPRRLSGREPARFGGPIGLT